MLFFLQGWSFFIKSLCDEVMVIYCIEDEEIVVFFVSNYENIGFGFGRIIWIIGYEVLMVVSKIYFFCWSIYIN